MKFFSLVGGVELKSSKDKEGGVWCLLGIDLNKEKIIRLQKRSNNAHKRKRDALEEGDEQ